MSLCYLVAFMANDFQFARPSPLRLAYLKKFFARWQHTEIYGFVYSMALQYSNIQMLTHQMAN